MAQPEFKVSGIVLDTPDPREVAGFYSQLLGWSVRPMNQPGSPWPIPMVG